eukprot:4241161-Prymnesium_polylepis.1
MSRPCRGRVASMSRHVVVVSRRCRGGVATCRDVSRRVATCRARDVSRTCRAHVAPCRHRVAPRCAALSHRAT